MRNLGLILFSIGLIGMGVLSLIYQGFALAWEPMPAPFPHRELLACISGGLLVVGGFGVLLPRTSKWAAFGLSAFISSWLLLQIILRILVTPLKLNVWTPFAETVMLVSGGWLLFASYAAQKVGGNSQCVLGPVGQRRLQLLFAFGPPVIAISHFVFAEGTAKMIATWIPFRLGLAYLSGVAHVAAGVGIFTGIAARLAAILETVMIGLFVLLVHVPLVVGHPTNRQQWTMLFFAIACTGACWIVASSFSRASSKTGPAAVSATNAAVC